MARHDHVTRVWLIGAVLNAALILSPQARAETRKLVVIQDAPALTDVDVGPKGKSHGDMLAFEAAIRSEAGNTGTLKGILVTVALPGGGRPHEGRIGQVYFDLGKGSSLVVSGGTVYLGQDTEMTVNAPQVRAVIGGTGEFIGARGQARRLDEPTEPMSTLLSCCSRSRWTAPARAARSLSSRLGDSPIRIGAERLKECIGEPNTGGRVRV